MKDPFTEIYKESDILETISEQIKSNNLKSTIFKNKYDKQTLMFVYDTSKKLCYNIDITTKIIHAIHVKYDEFVDEYGNFIYD